MDFGTIIRNSAQRYSKNVAVWDDGREQTYEELYDRSSRLANGLSGLGVKPGERVAMLSYNCLETMEQASGIAMGGFVRSGLYAHETGEVNGYLLELIDAKVLIVSAELYPMIAPKIPDLKKLQHVLVFDGPIPEGTRGYEQLLQASSPEDPRFISKPDDLHVIRFSAGTTGRPKGIVHTVKAWLDNNDEYRWVTPQLDERDAYLAAGQLTHAASLWLWPLLQVGGRIIVMKNFEAGRALRLIEEQRATISLVVPTMIQAMLAHPDIDSRDLSSMRCLNYAASPIAERTMTRAVDKFGPVLYQLYAQSEAITVTMMHPFQHAPDGDEHQRRLLRSVGRPTPNTVITIVNEDGAPVEQGEVGEIAVKAPGVMKEIWKDPETTAARFLADGSLLTRDMGYVDDEGYLFLADRKEDMIISGGYNIWPAELENAVESHPDVREVCVVGVPHEKWGETPMAFVVREPNTSVTAQELIDVTRSAVGSVKKVTAVEFVEELPKSGVGKILRRTVRDRAWKDMDAKIGGA